MIVVCDTSPVNYLVLINEIDLLPQLFTTVVLPAAVLTEVQHPRTPPRVASWARDLPMSAATTSFSLTLFTLAPTTRTPVASASSPCRSDSIVVARGAGMAAVPARSGQSWAWTSR